LDLYWRLLRDLKQNRRLFPARLTVLLEIDPEQKEKITFLIKRDFPLVKIVVLKDLDGFDRIVFASL
jgi:hypothetical protein